MSEGWHRVDGLSRDLALAVKLKDEVTGARPRGNLDVSVDLSDERPYRNPSGYYLFFDLPETSVTVEVDGGEWYRDTSKTVDLGADSFDRGSGVTVPLAPTQAYPFRAGVTRVRGMVIDDDAAVAEASVSVVGHSRTVETTEAGEFVYYFDDISDEDIERVDSDTDNGPTDTGESNSRGRSDSPGESDSRGRPSPEDVTDSEEGINVVNRYYKPDGAHPTFHVDGPPGTFEQSVKVQVGQLTTQNLTYPGD